MTWEENCPNRLVSLTFRMELPDVAGMWESCVKFLISLIVQKEPMPMQLVPTCWNMNALLSPSGAEDSENRGERACINTTCLKPKGMGRRAGTERPLIGFCFSCFAYWTRQL